MTQPTEIRAEGNWRLGRRLAIGSFAVALLAFGVQTAFHGRLPGPVVYVADVLDTAGICSGIMMLWQSTSKEQTLRGSVLRQTRWEGVLELDLLAEPGLEVIAHRRGKVFIKYWNRGRKRTIELNQDPEGRMREAVLALATQLPEGRFLDRRAKAAPRGRMGILPARPDAQDVRMRCRRMPDPTLIWGDVLVCGLLAGGLAGVTLGGERHATNWLSLGLWVMVAFIFYYLSRLHEVRLTGTVLSIIDTGSTTIDLARVANARLTLLPGNGVILDVQRGKRWKSFILEGDDIGPLREGLLDLVKPEAVIDLRSEPRRV